MVNVRVRGHAKVPGIGVAWVLLHGSLVVTSSLVMGGIVLIIVNGIDPGSLLPSVICYTTQEKYLQL